MSQSTRTVDIKRADEFTNLLLDALYALGGRLMPLNLTDRPASYDCARRGRPPPDCRDGRAAPGPDC